MSVERIKKILILGDSMAAWMTAAALIKTMPADLCSISILGSEDATKSTSQYLGVHPAGLKFHRFLGLNENELLKKTHGVFSFGERYQNYHKNGENYFVPYGRYGTELDAIAFHHHWLADTAAGGKTALGEYSLAECAALSGKFMRPENMGNSPVSQLIYGLHLDAGEYITFLKELSLANGVKKISDKVVNAGFRENGLISHIVTEKNGNIHADLFLDCSDKVSALFGLITETEREDWSSLFSGNSSITTKKQSSNPAQPSKNIQALSSSIALPGGRVDAVELADGWRYRAVTCKEKDKGTLLLKNVYPEIAFDKELVEDEIKPGKYNRAWIKNCVAIGKTFCELNGDTKIEHYLIQSAIFRLLSLFPDNEFRQPDIDEYNVQVNLDVQQVTNFLALPLYLSEWPDGGMWKKESRIHTDAELADKISAFKSAGRLYKKNNELFDESAWLSIFAGHHVKPHGWHQLATTMNDRVRESKLSGIRSVIQQSLKHMPTHYEYLMQNIHGGQQ